MRPLPCLPALLAASLAACLGLLDERPALARPDSKGSTDMWKYGANDVVKTFPSPGGGFRIHYAESGVNAVPAGDANANGTPDHVEDLALLYDQVLAFYQKLGFRAPPDDGSVAGNNGGDARFDVYLLDFAGKADGHFQKEQCTADRCGGYMIQENDFAGYPYASAAIGNRILSSHEFFHAVQAGYDAGQSTIIAEGTAVWATEKFDSSLDDFEGFVPGYLDRPDRSLDKPLPGAVDPFSYGAGLWFEFLDEHVGTDVIRGLWEDCQDGARGVDNPEWFTALAARLARDHHTDFGDELTTFARWNLLTGKYADPKRGWARGEGYSPVHITTGGRPPYRDDLLRLFYASSQYVRLPPIGREKMTAAVLPPAMQDTSALRLVLATRTGSRIGEMVDLPPASSTTPPPTIDTATVDELIVIAVNTAQSGDSIKGSLCIGSPEEVEPCLPRAPGGIDMAGGDVDAGADPPAGGDPGGGCAVGGREASGGRPIASLLGLAWCALAVRRRVREITS